MEAFNFHLPSMLLGLWGVKLYLLYASLIFLIPFAFTSTSEVTRYLRRYIYISLIVFSVCAIQFYAPVSSVWNVYAHAPSSLGSVAKFGGEEVFARVTGTFSFISGVGPYVYAITLLAFVMIVTGKNQSLVSRLLIGTAFVAGAGVIFMNGSRWPLIAWAISAVVLALISLQAGFMRGKKWRAAVLVLLAAIGISYTSQQAVSAFESRLGDQVEATEQRVWNRLVNPVKRLETAGFFGYGIGATYQASQVLTDQPKYSWLPLDRPADEATGQYMMELGLVGFVLLMGVYACLIILAYREAIYQRNSQISALCAAACAFLLISVTENVPYNAVYSAHYWGMVGIVVFFMKERKIDIYELSKSKG